MSNSNLYVLVTLKQSDGVYAAVDYQGTHYFVRMEDIQHINGNTYSVATYLLDLPLFSG